MNEPFIARHYASRAERYVTSDVHRHGDDLDAIGALAAESSFGHVLDLGSGGGHVAYCLAPHVETVLACDITPNMLDAIAREAAQRSLPNVVTLCAPAENLPLGDASFDAIFCRFTTHHWENPRAGLCEARRVLVPGGLATFIDVTAPVSPMVDSWLQTLELLRDVSHVRDYSCAEWEKMLDDAGLSIIGKHAHKLRMEFASWVARTGAPPVRIEAIRSLQEAAPEIVRDTLVIEPDGSFTVDVHRYVVVRI
ncbi:class I SAM-dependent methyltransferase [Swaminathania salitolerans]|uniref:S-adenosyl-L-methionine (SAM)-dependent methyltransferase PhcB n=1 Tax=Swaminathania salitolerans TaxID=182838 RepID=A0A511BQB9_9PROT|nr:class I SAM-dependent methyltransferase [Swaminathania salitolerans]GBQ11567.1 SAM-dependent methyltransferase [Swaminathania salitolerans LMG 21291]GEL02536.1 S-adenosyl-L-methionine (SAM)-dependent methyltransferase PhcB [Swaminathania salitolerans]